MDRAARFAAVLMAAALLAGCGAAGWTPAPGVIAFGPIRSPDDAIAAARLLSLAREPITIGSVKHGIAGELYFGPPGSYADQAGADEQLARLKRDAWRVDLHGVLDPGCDLADCAPYDSQIQLVIDSQYGTILFQSSTGP